MRSPGGRRLFVFAAESAFGTPDARAIENQTHVRGDADSAGMGAAVTIKYEDFRVRVQLGRSGNEGRRLSKRQQSGDVRKGNFRLCGGGLNLALMENVPDDPTGDDPRAVF